MVVEKNMGWPFRAVGGCMWDANNECILLYGTIITFKIKEDINFRICIHEGCRCNMDGQIHEIRETIINRGHNVLICALADKTYHYLKKFYF